MQHWTDSTGLRKPIVKKIFTTKISLQSSNPTFSYPIIRLPRELKELAGRIANVYQTEIDGVQGFFIALQLDKLDNLDRFVESNGQINSRSKSSPEPVISSKHPKNQWARPDSNRRPPPCQDRRLSIYLSIFGSCCTVFCSHLA
jgi:hypothetical protein